MIKTKLNLCGSLWNLSALCEIWLLHRPACSRQGTTEISMIQNTFFEKN
jgi:hypothetical protein